MDCLAADLVNASGLTGSDFMIPVDLDWSTSAFFVALSMAAFAASAVALASALAAVFSSAVKSVGASISVQSWLSKHRRLLCLVSVFATASGFTEVTSEVSLVLAWSTAAGLFVA